MGEILDHTVFVHIGLEESVVPPDLVLISYSPRETPLKKGEEVQVDVTVRNDGGDCKYKIKLVDANGSDQGVCGVSEEGEIIDEEPNTYLIGDTIRNGETKTVEVNTIGWCGAMPDESPAGTVIPIGGLWTLAVQAWHQT